jgi:hydrogenase/urease accessory protein HupE
MSWRALLTAAIVLGLAGAASAHALAPSLLELRELASGRVALRWKTPLVQPTGSELRPRPPAHCVETREPRLRVERAAAVEHRELDCGARGLEGATLGVDGLVRGGPNALVRATLRDGRVASAALHAGAPRFVVPARQAPAHVALGYLRLGLEHILLGLDHLLLVLGLVLLAPGRRALLCTISCFTAGHSVTLALATLGFVRLPAGPIEIAIAATLFWLGLELARPRERRESRSPRGRSATRAALLALGFGLLHGFGFAGALAEARPALVQRRNRARTARLRQLRRLRHREASGDRSRTQRTHRTRAPLRDRVDGRILDPGPHGGPLLERYEVTLSRRRRRCRGRRSRAGSRRARAR